MRAGAGVGPDVRAPIPDAEVTAVLGISTSRSRAGAALIRDGEVVAVAEEDSFPRDASEGGVPLGSIEHCLSVGGIEPAQVDYVGFHGKPLLELDRLLETYLARAPAGFRSFLETVPRWLDRELSRSREVGRALRGAFEKRSIYSEYMSI